MLIKLFDTEIEPSFLLDFEFQKNGVLIVGGDIEQIIVRKVVMLLSP